MEVVTMKDLEHEELIKSIIVEQKKRVYILSEILQNDIMYNKTREEIYEVFKQGFELREIRHLEIKFKWRPFAGEKVHTMQLRHFYTHLCLWYPWMVLGIPDELCDDDLCNAAEFTSKEREKFINERIIKRHFDEISAHEQNMILHDIIHLFKRVAIDFNLILGLTFNSESFMDLRRRNPLLGEIMNTKLDPAEQPAVSEKIVNDKTKQLVELLKNDENVLQAALRSGGAIKDKQLAEYMVSVSFRTDADANTLPIPINSNLMSGLKNLVNYYLETQSSRKSLLANKCEMGPSGYFAKRVMQLCSKYRISPTVEDCGSVKPLKFIVRSKGHLESIIGRYYYTEDNINLRCVTEKDTFLIGQTILLRSPETCSCKNSDHFCPICYGKLTKINKNLGVGGLAGAKASEPISQNVLSTKHLSVTDSESIEFPEIFDKYFKIISNEVFLDNNIEYNLSRLALVIKREDVMKINENDNTDYNDYIQKFYVRNLNTSQEEEFNETTMKELFLSPELVKSFEAGKKKDTEVIIPFNRLITSQSPLDDDDELARLFVIKINNNELTKPLHEIMDLLNYENSRPSGDLDELNQIIIDKMIEGHVGVPALFGEIMIRPLIRKESNILEVPNFKRYSELDDYRVTNINTALEKNQSVIISLSSRAVGRQFKDVRTFTKTETSYMDPLFRE